MTTAPNILFSRDGAIARIVLNRPDAGNAISIPLAKEMMDAAIQCDEDESIRCVILAGAGRMFCAGGDIGGFREAGPRAGYYLKEITAYMHNAVARLARMPKPLVTAVHGPAAGAGVSLAILGDIVLATPAAHFTMAYTAIGLTPDGGASWLLPRVVGMRKAQEFILTNRRVGAEEAVSIGLATRLVAPEALEEETQKLAEQLAAGATGALGRSRALL
ncbi:MAG: enoyl-CoA hydratase/isomerase family protein, partial [Caulobacterales bacterium]